MRTTALRCATAGLLVVSGLLAPGVASGAGTTQTYRADRPGRAVLVSDGLGCLILRHRQARAVTTRSCPVATVTVVP
jgi:hypothetical protein